LPEPVTNEDIYSKLEEIRKLLESQLTLYKLLNAKPLEDARAKILELEIRRKIFDACDNKTPVTQIAQNLFPGEPTEKSQPKVSGHIAILKDYGLVDYRDDKGVRYYFKKRG
jgi:DNA-binding transcriptional ArsR family regulator